MGSGGLYWACMGWAVMGWDVMLCMELPQDDVGVCIARDRSADVTFDTYQARSASLTMVHGEGSP